MTFISVVVPVAERPSSLDWFYTTFSPPLKAEGWDFEFVFALSADRLSMAETLRPLMEEGEPIRVLELGQAMGESDLLDAAVAHTTAPVVLALSPYPRVVPEALPILVKEVVDGDADLATGARARRSSPVLNTIQRTLFHYVLRRLVGGHFTDIASGVRAMRREVVEEIQLYGDFFRFLPVLAERQGFEVVEVRVPQHPEDQKARVYSPGTYLRRLIDLLGLMFLVRFVQKPLRFFGLVGSFLSLIGVVVLLVLFLQRIGGQGIADRPVLLLGVLFLVLGVQAFAMGLIGEIIVHLSASRRRLYRLRGKKDQTTREEGGQGP